MKLQALWRGEVVTVVSVKGGKVQIARACGLRWVSPNELVKAREVERARLERARLEKALEVLGAK